MDTIQITLTLPESLAERAKELGVLSDAEITRLIQAEVKRQEAKARLRSNLQKLRAVEPPITPEEIEAEIHAYRQEKATKSAKSDE
jgi:hypothetical protein